MRGWAAVAVLLVGNGCLLPYPEELPPLPGARNRPPRIEERNVTPGRIVNLSPLDGCQQAFSLKVADPDLDDTLTVYWFVDFDPTPRPGPVRIDDQDIIAPNLPPRDGEEVRDVSATFEVRSDTPGSPIAVPGNHLVEAYVADAQLQVVEEEGLRVIRPVGTVTAPPDGGLADQRYAVSYAWFVVTPQGCPIAEGGR